MKKILLYPILGMLVFLAGVLFVGIVILRPRIDSSLSLMPDKVKHHLALRNGAYVPLRKINRYVGQAAIVSQNENFYHDSGISIPGTARALFYTVIKHKRQGASTITEQLAKNVYFRDQDNLKTDIETKILALYMNRKFSKKKILELYLNDIYFGENAYGIFQASKAYYHTTPQKLSVYEAAYLIGLINAPSYLSQHPKQAQFVAKNVLEQMFAEHYITAKQEKQAEKNL